MSNAFRQNYNIITTTTTTVLTFLSIFVATHFYTISRLCEENLFFTFATKIWTQSVTYDIKMRYNFI